MSVYIDFTDLRMRISDLDEYDGMYFRTCDVFNTIWDSKIADVRENVHGEWIRKTDECCYWYECSVCGSYPPKNTYKHEWYSHFCPNCGADMRGDKQ